MVGGFAQIVWIGALYGATSFFPISRSGHLALAKMLFDMDQSAASLQMGFLAGTLGATVLLVKSSVVHLGLGLWRAWRRPATFWLSPLGRECKTVGLAQIPVLVLGLLLGDAEESLCCQPLVIAIGLFLTTLVLLSTGWAARGERQQPTWVQAILLGFGPGVAAFPGLSMTACTIAMATWFGLTARRSFEITLLVSLPATLVTMAQIRTAVPGSAQSLMLIVTGAAVTLPIGVLAGGMLRSAVVRGRFAWFSMWVAPLAIATFAFARAWPGR